MATNIPSIQLTESEDRLSIDGKGVTALVHTIYRFNEVENYDNILDSRYTLQRRINLGPGVLLGVSSKKDTIRDQAYDLAIIDIKKALKANPDVKIEVTEDLRPERTSKLKKVLENWETARLMANTGTGDEHPACLNH